MHYSIPNSKPPIVNPIPMTTWVDLAKSAINKDLIYVLVHTKVIPGTYTSTTDTA